MFKFGNPVRETQIITFIQGADFILKIRKQLLVFLALVVIFIGGQALPTGADETTRPDVRLILDRQLLNAPVKPISINNKPLIPLRFVSERLGATVIWNEGRKDASVQKGSTRLTYKGTLLGNTLMATPEFFKRMFNVETVLYADYNIIVMSTSGSAGIPSLSEALAIIPCYRGYNQEDLTWLSKIVEAEAKGESYASRLAVANVIINRKNNDQYPDSVRAVIFDQKHGVQFTPTANGSVYNEPDGKSYLAALEALEGKNNASTALFFYNPRLATSNWIKNNRQFAFTIGGHNYYY